MMSKDISRVARPCAGAYGQGAVGLGKSRETNLHTEIPMRTVAARRVFALTILIGTAACKTGGAGGDESLVRENGQESASDIQNQAPTDGTGQAPQGGGTAPGDLVYSEYEVRFTNPECAEYKYDPADNVKSNAGQPLTAKPKNVFCTSADSNASGSRPESPQFKLLEWINDPSVKEIFFAYLSFSNKKVREAVCNAITQRDVKVTFVMDTTSDRAQADQLLACVPPTAANKPVLHMRGHQGGIGYAHNKLFLINPGQETMKIAFSSGNMTSGIVLHHENWHFITLKSATYFAQSHLCLMKGVLTAHSSTQQYASFITQCRGQIPHQPEKNIRSFFVPGEGGKATDFITNAIKKASQIRLAAHRFGYNKLISALRTEMTSAQPAQLQMVFDDDTYWAGKGDAVGDNESWEYDNAMDLVNRGAKAKWMQTNHAGHLLHHNKYLIFNMPQNSATKPAVFCGAGNLTGTAFTSNFENFYYVEIPSVVDAYNKQYDKVWNTMASDDAQMPSQNVLPIGAQ